MEKYDYSGLNLEFCGQFRVFEAPSGKFKELKMLLSI